MNNRNYESAELEVEKHIKQAFASDIKKTQALLIGDFSISLNNRNRYYFG